MSESPPQPQLLLYACSGLWRHAISVFNTIFQDLAKTFDAGTKFADLQGVLELKHFFHRYVIDFFCQTAEPGSVKAIRINEIRFAQGKQSYGGKAYQEGRVKR